jgi:hypothetical protein
MFVTMWTFAQACLFILGAWWCREILGRLGKDVDDVKSPRRPGERWIVIFYWGLTACIMSAMGWFAYGLVSGVIDAL